jgi:hypothetical protein
VTRAWPTGAGAPLGQERVQIGAAPAIAARPELGEQPPTILLTGIPACTQIRLEGGQSGRSRCDQCTLGTGLGAEEAAHRIGAYVPFSDDLPHALACSMESLTGREAELAPRLCLCAGALARSGVAPWCPCPSRAHHAIASGARASAQGRGVGRRLQQRLLPPQHLLQRLH